MSKEGKHERLSNTNEIVYTRPVLNGRFELITKADITGWSDRVTCFAVRNTTTQTYVLNALRSLLDYCKHTTLNEHQLEIQFRKYRDGITIHTLIVDIAQEHIRMNEVIIPFGEQMIAQIYELCDLNTSF